LGFSQRQAAGKFTRDEADAFIEALQSEAESPEGEPEATPAPPAAAKPRAPVAAPALRRVPAEQLAAELQRRGWIVVGP
jgi:hypothetical protein